MPFALSRREFLAGVAGAALTLAGCTATGSRPLRQSLFPPLDAQELPYLGLATSLPEEHDYPCRLKGALPRGLRGTLYRNGPALFDRGGLRKHTLFDGDGMVQAFRFHNGGVHYRNRYVRTEKYVAEERAGRFLYPTVSTLAPGGLLANLGGVMNVRNQAGVTVYLRNGRLFAFDEFARPYELDPHTLHTVGPSDLGVPGRNIRYAAHSKIDRATGHWVHFGLEFGRTFTLHLTEFDRAGALFSYRKLPLPRTVYMHDFFVTERRIVLHLHPMEFALFGMLVGYRSVLASMRWRPDEGTLLMVLDREGADPPVLIKTGAAFMWHGVNAYDRPGGEIVADLVAYDRPDHMIGPDPVATAVMTGRPGQPVTQGELRRYVIRPSSRSVQVECTGFRACEFPRVNDLRLCHPHRFAYLLKSRGREYFWSGVARVDTATGRTDTFDFGPGRYATEPVFAPLPGRAYDGTSAEEPGWVLTEVYDGSTKQSFLAVLDAERVPDGPVAVAHLRHHVPFSFHGFWQALPESSSKSPSRGSPPGSAVNIPTL